MEGGKGKEEGKCDGGSNSRDEAEKWLKMGKKWGCRELWDL